jgi:hypothetical protein
MMTEHRLSSGCHIAVGDVAPQIIIAVGCDCVCCGRNCVCCGHDQVCHGRSVVWCHC